MRKNGINRELRPIEGGVCAPEGYKANAVSCGFKSEGLDFGMILSERRCAVACTYATGRTLGAPVKVSKRNMRYGYARAILVNGGAANAIGADGERLALSVCDLFFPYTLERTEIVLASTGKIGKPLRISAFAQGVKPLWEGLDCSHGHSLRVAEAMADEGKELKQLSFAFDLGDYPCKIGVVFKGGPQVSPDMATFLAFLTTDVNISTPMLQRALTSEVKETLNMLNLDGTASPNDTVCILANGRAGNYKIDCADSEYKKFKLALRAVLTEICLATAREGAKPLLTCRVRGALSKETARAVAKALVGAECIKTSVACGELDLDGALFTLLSAANEVKTERLRLSVRAGGEEIAFYALGERFFIAKEVQERIFAQSEVEIGVDLGEGNYPALAYGRIAEKT